MEITSDGKINFDKVIVTPLERWVDTDLELKPSTVEELKKLAEKSNQSVDNVVNHILSDIFAEHLELSKLTAETLRETAEKSPQILLLENGKPVAQVKMIEDSGGQLVLVAKRPHLKGDSAQAQTKPVTNCDRLASVAAMGVKRKRREGAMLQ